VYFQPSEPLKLLFIIYMAAYLADRMPLSLRPLPLLAPTAFVMAIALLLLIIQRDLGTASIFIVLYTVILYVASGKKRILLISLAGLAIAGVAGYFLFDVVRLRVDAWLNPWLDPSGRSFQIVQSLMAVANGGTSGRGPGLGSPGLVPVAISDLFLAAVVRNSQA
jgi:cell division protein FtsW (lipid II flippase)